MTNLPSWVAKVTTAWVAAGTFLIILGSQGVALPDFITSLFSQAFVDAVLQVVGAIITFVQFIRTIFVVEAEASYARMVQMNPNAQHQARTYSKTAFALNPFKLTA